MTTTEKKFECAIYGGASAIVTKLNEKLRSGDKTWEMVSLTKDSEYYEQSFAIRHNGEFVIQIGRLHGFAFGSNVWHLHLNKFQYNKLNELGIHVEWVLKFWGKSDEEIRNEIMARQ
jgi:hypothetical protein